MLHRLFAPGSDRAAEKWKDDYAIQGVGDLNLHHLYRAMAWVGEVLPKDPQDGATPFAPRTNKDLIEEALFARRRDLFSDLDMVFFDTTSIYFEGEGGETIGQWRHSKDHRPDLKQMVVGMVLDQQGNPLCSELWPGNTADVKSLVPIVERLKSRFGIGSVSIVADRGMISAETLEEVEKREWKYILGVRMRRASTGLPTPRVAAHAPSDIIRIRLPRFGSFWRASCCGSCLIVLFAGYLKVECRHRNPLHQCRSVAARVVRSVREVLRE